MWHKVACALAKLACQGHIGRLPNGWVGQQAVLALEEGGKSARTCLAREVRSDAHAGDVGLEPGHELPGKVRTGAVTAKHGAQE